MLPDDVRGFNAEVTGDRIDLHSIHTHDGVAAAVRAGCAIDVLPHLIRTLTHLFI